MSPEALSMFNKDGSSVEIIGAEHSPEWKCIMVL